MTMRASAPAPMYIVPPFRRPSAYSRAAGEQNLSDVCAPASVGYVSRSDRKEDPMPPRGVEKGTKRARQYEHIKDSVRERGGSLDEAEEIASRTVNKERARSGEASESSRLSREDISSGRRGGLRSRRKGPRGRTRDQLYEEAKERNIRGRSKMTKAELQRALGGRR
jgi:hypothetical protein